MSSMSCSDIIVMIKAMDMSCSDIIVVTNVMGISFSDIIVVTNVMDISCPDIMAVIDILRKFSVLLGTFVLSSSINCTLCRLNEAWKNNQLTFKSDYLWICGVLAPPITLLDRYISVYIQNYNCVKCWRIVVVLPLSQQYCTIICHWHAA